MVLGLFSLARLPTETARVIFLNHFLKKKRLYHSSSASRTFSMPRQDFFVPCLLPSRGKIFIERSLLHILIIVPSPGISVVIA